LYVLAPFLPFLSPYFLLSTSYFTTFFLSLIIFIPPLSPIFFHISFYLSILMSIFPRTPAK
jgi:hypothetical protein